MFGELVYFVREMLTRKPLWFFEKRFILVFGFIRLAKASELEQGLKMIMVYCGSVIDVFGSMM